jgi:dolichol-phosphate mannosyltransferase
MEAHLQTHVPEPGAREPLARPAESGRRSLRRPRPLISVVSPVYRAEATVAELVRRIGEAVALLTESFEIVLVDDGSPDRAWERIEECCHVEPRVVGVRLSRNFGQHPAITAGLAHARGDWVVVMDCDLQDNPSYIPELYRRALDGYDIVYTIKEKREHGAVKNWFAGQFARVSNWLSSGDTTDPRIGAYSLISRRVVESFLRIHDVHRHYLVLLRWLGFPSTAVTIRHEPRFAGRSSYSFLALARHAVDGIVSHSDRLLYLSVAVGFSFLCISLLGIVYLVVAYMESGFRAGWTSTIVLILLCTSMILLSIGTAGIYIGKIFEQVKQRPLYLVDQVRRAPANHVRESSPGG